ncbi:MAG: cation transporter [Bauldia sp.]|nr:cation transporter [Bauldia sp.]
MAHHHHHHGHGHHGHDHSHGPSAAVIAGDRKVAWAIAVNLALTVAQVIGGIAAGSLALIADAIHNLSDAASLVIAFGARRIARRPSDPAMTFGYGRAEIVAALINYTTLIVIALYLAYEGVWRLIEPQPVLGWVVVIIAGIALVIDVVTALLTYRLSKESVNIRAAFLHNVADALGSVGVIVAGTLIILYDWRIVDAIVTLGIAAYILWHVSREIGGVIRILMQGSPADIPAEDVVARLVNVPGVDSVHHLHVWQIDEREASVEAHLVLTDEAAARPDVVRRAAKKALAADFGIMHSTLELETRDACCPDATPIGHAAPATGTLVAH